MFEPGNLIPQPGLATMQLPTSVWTKPKEKYVNPKHAKPARSESRSKTLKCNKLIKPVKPIKQVEKSV